MKAVEHVSQNRFAVVVRQSKITVSLCFRKKITISVPNNVKLGIKEVYMKLSHHKHLEIILNYSCSHLDNILKTTYILVNHLKVEVILKSS